MANVTDLDVIQEALELTMTTHDGQVLPVEDCIELNGVIYALDDDDLVCDVDGNVMLIEESVSIDGDFYAQDDRRVRHCEDCREYVHRDNSYCLAFGNGFVCQDCIDNGEYCEPVDTNGLLHRDNAYYDEDAGEWYADYDNVPSRSSGNIHDAGEDIFHVLGRRAYIGKDKVNNVIGRSLVFGVELETDTRNSDMSDIADTLHDNTDYSKYGICKEDGSISGAELVTLPGDLAAHKLRYDWPAWCKSIAPIAKGYHAGNAGIHVHINRKALSDLTLGKMLVFMNDNRHEPMLSAIAQRDLKKCQWAPQKTFLKVSDVKHKASLGKYSILNVTRDTVECRMFRSNLMPERVLKNIEFCDALVNFCKSTSVKSLNEMAFLSYVKANKNRYNQLDSFLAMTPVSQIEENV